MKTGEPFTFAGLWDVWKSSENEIIVSTVIITTKPNDLMRQIHDRMPVIIAPEERKLWLSDEFKGNDLSFLFKPYPSEEMIAYPISEAVNSPLNNHSNIILPIKDEF
jgi:putative SOS response-associated peptidase YedK